MKKQITLAACIFLMLCFSSNHLIAQQFTTQGPLFGDRFAATNGIFPNNIKAVGIGQFTAVNPPLSAFHINTNLLTPTTANPLTFAAGEVFRTDCPLGLNTFWRMQRGGFARGRLFSRAAGAAVLDRNNFSIQSDSLDITFHTVPIPANGMGQERVRMVGPARTFGILAYPVRPGSVGIGTQNPVAMLHLGLNAFPNTIGTASGYRVWMNVGTLMIGSPTGFDPATGTDNMYVGLRQVGADQENAIINWGNNPANSGQADRLLFTFTAAPGNGQASTLNGLETGRSIVNLVALNTVRGFTGIGGDPTVNVYSNLANAQDPQNTLEVNSPAPTLIPVNNPNTSTGFSTLNGHPAVPPALTPPTGFSGLRITDLTSGSIPENNPSANVLSVDANGDVILVPGGGALSLLCTNPASQLPTGPGFNARVGLNGNNFYFEGNASGLNNDNSVLIGLPCGSGPSGKLEVFQNSGVANTIGIDVINSDPANTSCTGPVPVIGIRSIVNNLSLQQFKVAGWFQADQAPNCIGSLPHYAIFTPNQGGVVDIGFPFSLDVPDFALDVNGFGRTTAGVIPSDSILKTNVSPFNSGLSVIRQMHPKFYNYNGKGGFDTQHQYIGLMAQQLSSIAPYAVVSSVQKLDSTDANYTPILNVYNEAVMYTTINAVKQLDSTINRMIIRDSIIGRLDTARQVAYLSASDSYWKTNVQPIQNALQKVTQLNGITYDWNLSTCQNMNVSDHPQMGLIAQDVEQVVPEVVYTDSNGRKYIDYGRLVAILIEAVKEVNNNSITNNNNKSQSQTEIEKIKLTLPDAPVLGDARPNPNSGYAEIPYYLPEGTVSAKIIFIDMLGRTMQEKNLSAGYGVIGIDTQDLPNGTYTYTMIINDKTIGTKTMVRTR